MDQYWAEMTKPQLDALRHAAQAAVDTTGTSAEIEVKRGRPADHLLELSREVDLLVIGSRRWGPITRVLLGSTGEALMHDAACPVLAVPRPAE